MVVASRRHTLLPLDDCLYAFQPSIAHLTRSTLHRCLERHGISRYPIGYFHIDIADIRTEQAGCGSSSASIAPAALMHWHGCDSLAGVA